MYLRFSCFLPPPLLWLSSISSSSLAWISPWLPWLPNQLSCFYLTPPPQETGWPLKHCPVTSHPTERKVPSPPSHHMANPFLPAQMPDLIIKSGASWRPPSISLSSLFLLCLSSQPRSLPEITVVTCVRVYGLAVSPPGCQNTACVLVLSHPYSPPLPKIPWQEGGVEAWKRSRIVWGHGRSPYVMVLGGNNGHSGFSTGWRFELFTQLKRCDLSRERLCQWIPARKTDKARKCYLPSINVRMGVEVHPTWTIFLALGWG